MFASSILGKDKCKWNERRRRNEFQLMLWKQEIRSYEIAKLKDDFVGRRLDTRMISLFGSMSLIPVFCRAYL